MINIKLLLWQISLLILFFIHPVHSQSEPKDVKIYFEINKFSISQISSNLLNVFIKNYQGKGKISIIGRADSQGDNQLNDTLSKKRARAVKEYLIKNGFPQERIGLVTGLGKRSPVPPYTDSLNRVVWISMTYEDPSKEIKAYSIRDSIILLYPPYRPEYLILKPLPHKGDTLKIDTTLKQLAQKLFIKRTLYIAEALVIVKPEDCKITAYSSRDSLVMVLPPYEPGLKPQRGDTLKIDTVLTKRNTTLFIKRIVFIADNKQTKKDFVRREIPEKVKRKHLMQAFADTLQNTFPGQAIIIRSLSFEFGYHVLLKEKYPALDAVAQALQKNQFLKLEISAHTCCGDLGKDALDKQTGEDELSVNRASVIYDYLIQKGVDKSRISYKGAGMNEPIAHPELGKNDQYKNRRIEFLVVEK